MHWRLSTIWIIANVGRWLPTEVGLVPVFWVPGRQGFREGSASFTVPPIANLSVRKLAAPGSEGGLQQLELAFQTGQTLGVSFQPNVGPLGRFRQLLNAVLNSDDLLQTS